MEYNHNSQSQMVYATQDTWWCKPKLMDGGYGGLIILLNPVVWYCGTLASYPSAILSMGGTTQMVSVLASGCGAGSIYFFSIFRYPL